MAREAGREKDMTIAVEHPVRSEAEATMDLLDIAEWVFREKPGFRAEIIGGLLFVNPPPDVRHQDALTNLILALSVLHAEETRVQPGIGLWLPNGKDYAIPDLAVVDADIDDHLVAFNCYAPSVFRLVVEITSSNHSTDTVDKPRAYAEAGVPVYLIGDRRRGEVVVLTEPRDGAYRTRSVYRPGESLSLPESIGAAVKLDVDTVLGPRSPR